MAAPAGDVDDNEEGAVVRAAELKLPTLDVEDGDDDDDDAGVTHLGPDWPDDGDDGDAGVTHLGPDWPNNDDVEADGDRDSICITSTLSLK